MIYISYDPQDIEVLNELTEGLKAAGLPVSIHDYDAYSYVPPVQRADVRRARLFVVLLSPTSYQSDVVRQELDAAKQLGKKIVPVVVKALPADVQLSRGTYLDATGGIRRPLMQIQRMAQQIENKTTAEIASVDIPDEQPESQEMKIVLPPRPPLPTNRRSSPRRWLAGIAATAIFMILIGVLSGLFRQNPTIESVVIGNPRDHQVAQVPTETPEPTETIATTLVPAESETPQSTSTATTSPTMTHTAVPQELIPSVLALFYLNPYEGQAPLTIAVENVSEGDIAAYEWDFNGDGAVDFSQRNPSAYIFSIPGTYPITLTVKGTDGTQHSYTDYAYVYAPQQFPVQVAQQATPVPIIANFTVSPDYGNAPLNVNFMNNSQGPITNYAWDFNGDGITDSTAQTPPSYTYQQSGIYTVRLTVSGPGGQNQASVTVTVTQPQPVESPPVALFDVIPGIGDAPLIVGFLNQSQGNITSYAWDFNGDGVVDSTIQNPPPYTYEIPGDYRVSLVVTGPGGTSQPHYETVSAEPPQPPFAYFGIEPDYGVAPLQVIFQNFSEGNITSYAWDFDGDGITDSTLARPEPYIFSEPGDYEITLIVSGPSGISEPEYGYVSVDALEAPYAIFSVSPDSGYAPLQVTFTNESEGQITDYAWDFDGDGNIDSTAQNPPVYAYTDPGSYEASLIVSGDGGISESEIHTITVEAIEAPAAAFNASPNTGYAPLNVTFTNESQGQITAYAWDFNGDGVTDSTAVNPPIFAYTLPGTYQASLIVTGPGGTSEAYVVSIVVEPQVTPEETPQETETPEVTEPPVPTETDIPEVTEPPELSETPTDESSETPTDDVSETPTDDDTEITDEPSETPTDEASETPETAEPPVAGFMVLPADGIAPLTATFSNLSTGEITSYAWDLNGDTIIDSVDKDPLPYVYTLPGTYNVTLTVTGPGGTSLPLVQTVFVYVALSPVAKFSAQPSRIQASSSITFTDESTGNITGYAWDFDGDGTADDFSAAPPPVPYTTPGTYYVSLTVSGPGGTSAPYVMEIIVDP